MIHESKIINHKSTKQQPLLCIVGPTATGKTALALEIAGKQPSILVSADSRQVYRGMDIVTGKDHPRETHIYGVDMVDPNEPCSVSTWYDAVMPYIETAWSEGKLPIVVGGTGLYIKALTSGIATIHIPPNEMLRKELGRKSVVELQLLLQKNNPEKLASMNESDRANPRRLIRAIEIANSPQRLRPMIYDLQSKLIGLCYFNEKKYQEVVEVRVRARLAEGAVEETKHLISRYDEHVESLTAIGYRSIVMYLKGEIGENQMIEKWVHDELAYAKRQMVWFKKQQVEWHFVDKPDTIEVWQSKRLRLPPVQS